MIYGYRMNCCGIIELTGVRDYYRLPTETTLLRSLWIQAMRHEWRFAQMIFTDHRNCRRGKTLCKIIQKYKLGPVLHSKRKMNHNSGNHIQTWVWDVDQRALKALGRQQGWNKQLEEERREWEKKTRSIGWNNFPRSWEAPELVRLIDLGRD